MEHSLSITRSAKFLDYYSDSDFSYRMDNPYLALRVRKKGVHNRTVERMKVRLFIEPDGKAREQIQLESCVPFDIELFRKWTTSWISVKELKKWNKAKWAEDSLGIYKQGKIFEAINIDQSQPLKGELIAYRSYVLDNTGAKKKLPVVLVAKIKRVVDFNFFEEHMEISQEQETEIRDALKREVWGPISIYQSQKADRTFVVDINDVLAQSIQYLKGLYERNPVSVGLPPFIETEVLKN